MILIHARMKSQATFHRTARIVVLHPVACKMQEFVLFAFNNNSHLDTATRTEQGVANLIG
jgi:hypothetical protein